MSLLNFTKVSRRFPVRLGNPSTTPPVLDEIDLTLAPGDVTALVGRSGEGKTTLLYLAAGLLSPTDGRVLFDGRDLAGLSAADLSRLRRRDIGMAFQNNLCLSALSTWENAALPLLLEGRARRDARRDAHEMLERVGLLDFAPAPTATLSGGQRRRLGLARAMLGQPRLLLADEPTADLDEKTAQEVEQTLFEWLASGDHSALIVTHEPALERRATRVLRLANGHLSEAAPDPV